MHTNGKIFVKTNFILFLINMIAGLICYFLTHSYFSLIIMCVAIIILVAIYMKKILYLYNEIESIRKTTLYELTKNAAICHCDKWSDIDKNHMYDEMWKFSHNHGRKPSDLFEIMAEVIRDRETDYE